MRVRRYAGDRRLGLERAIAVPDHQRQAVRQPGGDPRQALGHVLAHPGARQRAWEAPLVVLRVVAHAGADRVHRHQRLVDRLDRDLAPAGRPAEGRDRP